MNKTFPNSDVQGVWACLRNGDRITVERPNLPPLFLVPEFLSGVSRRVLWSVRIHVPTKKKLVRRIPASFEDVERWIQ